MSQCFDLTQYQIECALKIFSYKIDNNQKKKMKADASQCMATLIQAVFFMIWYFTDDGDDKYTEIPFIISIIIWLIYDAQIYFCQYDYIKGLKNDLDFRETWGKMADLLSNLILLIYFTIYFGADIFYYHSPMYVLMYVIIIINFILDLTFFILMIFKDKFKCCQTEQNEHLDIGPFLFMLFGLFGVGLSFTGIYFGYIRERGKGRNSEPFLLLGMIGDVVIALGYFFLLNRYCKTPERDITWHKAILMIVQGLAFGMCCFFLSVLLGIGAFVYFICLCLWSMCIAAKNAIYPA